MTRLLAGIVGVFSGVAQAQFLWNTGPWDGVDARASDQVSDGSRPPNRAADDFALPPGNGSAYQLTQLRGQMLASKYSGFFAEIYPDNAGEPGETPIAVLPQQSLTVLDNGVFGLYDLLALEFDTTDVSLIPGVYWVSLVGNVGGIGNEGYAFFCTAGSGTLMGAPGFFKGGAQPWKPIILGLGFDTDFSFDLDGEQGAAGCKPDCEGDQDLDIFDFLCFQGKFSVMDPYGDFEEDGDWDIFDFLAFQGAYATGC